LQFYCSKKSKKKDIINKETKMAERRSKEQIRKGLIELGEKPGSKSLEAEVERIYKYEKLMDAEQNK